MSNATPPPAPGLRDQRSVRIALRVAGVLLLGVGLVLLAVAGVDFFASFDSAEAPGKFWMFFIALPLLGLGSWLAMAGFMGVGARYAAGEHAPVLKDTAHYLTDGEGLFGVGRSPADRAADRAAGQTQAGGPFCRSCGTRNDDTARFCDSCGSAMA